MPASFWKAATPREWRSMSVVKLPEARAGAASARLAAGLVADLRPRV